ncbi:hypothetical protein C7U85_26915 [Bradyrhizobium sp. WBAH42]|nr:hypothetical protein [Bradyrhizobium sp. WBAH42]
MLLSADRELRRYLRGERRSYRGYDLTGSLWHAISRAAAVPIQHSQVTELIIKGEAVGSA